MTIHFHPIKRQMKSFRTLIQHMDLDWFHAGQAYGILPELIKKEAPILEDKIQGMIGIHNGGPVCAAWVDIPHGHYGSLVVHATENSYRAPLIQSVHKQNLLYDLVVELVQLRSGLEYRDALCELGYSEKERKRLLLEIELDDVKTESPADITFEAIHDNNIERVSQMSVIVHKPRIKYEGYHEFINVTRRIEMTQRIRSSQYGIPIDGACIIMKYKGEPVGFCDTIDIECWGFKHIAWIMDIGILPEFQGCGLANILLHQVQSSVWNQNIPAIGLSVTCSNISAVSLYERFGFREIEYFIEFLSPDIEYPD